MTVAARVLAIRDLPAGGGVGYGATYRASAPTRIATIGFGYADGFPVSGSNRMRVWLAGAARPVVGRVSMDYIGVDVGAARVEVGSEAVIFGAGPDGGIPVEEAAEDAGTLSYELLVRVGSRVAREVLR
jgi:alanine racemase